MKILLLVASYPPVLESAGRLYSQLAESLVQAGHQVSVLTEHPAPHLPVERPHGYFERPASCRLENGVRVLRVSPLEFVARIPGGKASRFLLSCLLYTLRGWWLNRQDVILVYSPPLFMGIAGHLISLRHRCRFVLNVQDLHPKVLFDSGVIRHRWLRRLLLGMESICYRKAGAFIVYSAGNRDYLLEHGARGTPNVIPNWVDVSAVTAAAGANPFRAEEGIGDRLLISYAGTMQSAQGLEVVVAAAEELRGREDIVFFLAGEGSAKADLQRRIDAAGLANVRLRPVMPAARYLQCLLASDVCLVTLGVEVPLQTVPGKLAYNMACGKPILAAVNLQGDAAGVVRSAGAGICVSPGDVAGFVEAVRSLHRDVDARRAMGRRAADYARDNFSREACTKRFEAVLRAACPA